MKHLFVMLSYIDDCENEVDAISVKNDMSTDKNGTLT